MSYRLLQQVWYSLEIQAQLLVFSFEALTWNLNTRFYNIISLEHYNKITITECDSDWACMFLEQKWRWSTYAWLELFCLLRNDVEKVIHCALVPGRRGLVLLKQGDNLIQKLCHESEPLLCLKCKQLVMLHVLCRLQVTYRLPPIYLDFIALYLHLL